MRIANYSFIGLMDVMRSVGKHGKVIDIIPSPHKLPLSVLPVKGISVGCRLLSLGGGDIFSKFQQSAVVQQRPDSNATVVHASSGSALSKANESDTACKN